LLVGYDCPQITRISTDYAYLSSIFYLPSINLIFLSISYFLSFIFYPSLIHLSPIRHRSRQAEHPLMAALRARRVAMYGAHSRRKGVLCLPAADSRQEPNKIRKGMKTLRVFAPRRGTPA
jgi:hypothetical protein